MWRACVSCQHAGGRRTDSLANVSTSPIMPTLVPRDLDARFANALQVRGP